MLFNETTLTAIESAIGALTVSDTLYPDVTGYRIAGGWRGPNSQPDTYENFLVKVFTTSSENTRLKKSRNGVTWERDETTVTFYYLLPPRAVRKITRNNCEAHHRQIRAACVGIIGAYPDNYEIRWLRTDRRETDDAAYLEYVITFEIDRQTAPS